MNTAHKIAMLAIPTLLAGATPALADGTCTGTPVAELNKTWSKGDSFGDENFGGAYSVSATLTGKRDGLAVKGDLNAEASLFGNTQNIVKVDVAAQAAVVGRSASENIDVFVVGKNIFHHARSSGTSDGSGITLSLAKNFDVSFFDASKRFWVGPIPIRVRAKASGSAGFNFNSSIGVFAVHADLRPSAKAIATASASIDAGVGEAGVDGSLNLVDATVPTTGSLDLNTSGISYEVASDLALNYLSGRINVWGKLIFGKRHEKKIADWSGTTKNIALAHESGCIKLF